MHICENVHLEVDGVLNKQQQKSTSTAGNMRAETVPRERTDKTKSTINLNLCSS